MIELVYGQAWHKEACSLATRYFLSLTISCPKEQFTGISCMILNKEMIGNIGNSGCLHTFNIEIRIMDCHLMMCYFLTAVGSAPSLSSRILRVFRDAVNICNPFQYYKCAGNGFSLNIFRGFLFYFGLSSGKWPGPSKV